MLSLSDRVFYFVYTSWMTIGPSYREVIDILVEHLNGYPSEGGVIPALSTYEGSAGGGIIRVECPYPHTLLRNAAFKCLRQRRVGLDRTFPSFTEGGEMSSNVTLLVDHDDGMWMGGEGPRPKEATCYTTFDHLDGAGERVFWVIDVKVGTKTLKAFSELGTLVNPFGMSILPLEPVPSDLLAETTGWFVLPDRQHTWFEVSGGMPDLGFQDAVAAYVTNVLGTREKRRMFGIRLLADIEGRPWFARPRKRSG